MRKKVLLLILILITCTGCSVEYNINITENNIEEEINVTDYKTSKRTNEEILTHYNTWYPTFVNYIKNGESIELNDYSKKVNGIEYHEKTINNIKNGYQYSYKYTYNIDEYYDAYVLARTFYETNVNNGHNNLVLKTSKANLLCQYDYFEKVEVNITIDPKIYKLKYTNTSNIKNNTYKWILDRNNCNDGQIILTLDKINDETNNTTNNPQNNINNQKDINNYTLYIFFVVLALLILLGYKWFNNFKEKNNNID